MLPEVGAVFGEGSTSHPPFRTANIAVGFYYFPVYAVHATWLSTVHATRICIKLLCLQNCLLKLSCGQAVRDFPGLGFYLDAPSIAILAKDHSPGVITQRCHKLLVYRPQYLSCFKRCAMGAARFTPINDRTVKKPRPEQRHDPKCHKVNSNRIWLTHGYDSGSSP